MTSKKQDPVIPAGSVEIETVRSHPDFDPFAQIPEVQTFRDLPEAADSKAADTKQPATSANSKEK